MVVLDRTTLAPHSAWCASVGAAQALTGEDVPTWELAVIAAIYGVTAGAMRNAMADWRRVLYSAGGLRSAAGDPLVDRYRGNRRRRRGAGGIPSSLKHHLSGGLHGRAPL